MDEDKGTRRPPYANYQERQLADLHLWMTTQEAAEYSGYDVQYVRRLARQSKIGAVKKGRDWWIDVEKFTAYLRTMIESKDGRAGPKPMLQEDP
jgi:excisionase family DNA binding protein